jgi:hypothetical protein
VSRAARVASPSTVYSKKSQSQEAVVAKKSDSLKPNNLLSLCSTRNNVLCGVLE